MPAQAISGPALILTRLEIGDDGAFGKLSLADTPDQQFLVTLERTFGPTGRQVPVIPEGTYECVRGTHQLTTSKPFETFEITGVAGHTGLLFHWGNWETDSEGCVLLGKVRDTLGGRPAVLSSHLAFSDFMYEMSGADMFTLTVVNGLHAETA